jgi:hypothetical protein
MKRHKEKAASKGCNPADGNDSETIQKDRISETVPSLEPLGLKLEHVDGGEPE